MNKCSQAQQYIYIYSPTLFLHHPKVRFAIARAAAVEICHQRFKFANSIHIRSTLSSIKRHSQHRTPRIINHKKRTLLLVAIVSILHYTHVTCIMLQHRVSFAGATLHSLFCTSIVFRFLSNFLFFLQFNWIRAMLRVASFHYGCMQISSHFPSLSTVHRICYAAPPDHAKFQLELLELPMKVSLVWSNYNYVTKNPLLESESASEFLRGWTTSGCLGTLDETEPAVNPVRTRDFLSINILLVSLHTRPVECGVMNESMAGWKLVASV